MKSMKRQKDRILKDELPRSVGANMLLEKSRERRNEEFEPKQSQSPFVDVSGGESKVQCYKEQYYIRTWKVRSMNQSELEVVKQEMARRNIDI